jgi:hypothetical protein
VKIFKEGYQVVIVPNGSTKEEFITSIHTRMEFSSDGLTIYVRDIAFNSSYTNPLSGGSSQETFSCLVADLKNEAGTLVGDYQAVRNYLLTFIGS